MFDKPTFAKKNNFFQKRPKSLVIHVFQQILFLSKYKYFDYILIIIQIL